jgi:hypothetical protein
MKETYILFMSFAFQNFKIMKCEKIYVQKSTTKFLCVGFLMFIIFTDYEVQISYERK